MSLRPICAGGSTTRPSSSKGHSSRKHFQQSDPDQLRKNVVTLSAIHTTHANSYHVDAFAVLCRYIFVLDEKDDKLPMAVLNCKRTAKVLIKEELRMERQRIVENRPPRLDRDSTFVDEESVADDKRVVKNRPPRLNLDSRPVEESVADDERFVQFRKKKAVQESEAEREKRERRERRGKRKEEKEMKEFKKEFMRELKRARTGTDEEEDTREMQGWADRLQRLLVNPWPETMFRPGDGEEGKRRFVVEMRRERRGALWTRKRRFRVEVRARK